MAYLHCMRYVPLQCVFYFYLDKIDVTMDGNIVSNSDVPLRIHLRRAIHFDYEIEFVDNNEVISTMEGEKGKEMFHHIITVHRDTELMARLKIGEVRGPESDAVTIDVTEGMLIFTHVTSLV